MLIRAIGEDISTKEAKIALCKKHYIALFDCAKSLKRDTGNSSDSNLKDINTNDFKQLLSAYGAVSFDKKLQRYKELLKS